MGRLSPFTDITGKLSQSDINAEDISNIIDEFNKIQDAQTGHIQQTSLATIINDGTTNRILNGYQSVLDQWGLFVSKVGIDVTKATADQLIFNSNQDIFKIVASSTLTLTFTRSSSGFATYSATVAHGLSYTPAFLPYITMDPTLTGVSLSSRFSSIAPIIASIGGNFSILGMLYVVVDSANIYFQCDISGVATGTYTNTAKVYLLQETFN